MPLVCHSYTMRTHTPVGSPAHWPPSSGHRLHRRVPCRIPCTPYHQNHPLHRRAAGLAYYEAMVRTHTHPPTHPPTPRPTLPALFSPSFFPNLTLPPHHHQVGRLGSKSQLAWICQPWHRRVNWRGERYPEPGTVTLQALWPDTLAPRRGVVYRVHERGDGRA